MGSGASTICSSVDVAEYTQHAATSESAALDPDPDVSPALSTSTYEDRRPSALSITEASPVFIPRSEDVLVTPGRERALYSCVIRTPTGELTHIYKYYCPLCTLYFENILRSQCCGNYSCINCTLQYVEKKGERATSINDILKASAYRIPCPSCCTEGFQPKLVQQQENVRDYSTGGSLSGYASQPVHSPIKVGDTYENLIKKMQPFPDVRQQLLFTEEEYALSEGLAAHDDETAPPSMDTKQDLSPDLLACRGDLAATSTNSTSISESMTIEHQVEDGHFELIPSRIQLIATISEDRNTDTVGIVLAQ